MDGRRTTAPGPTKSAPAASSRASCPASGPRPGSPASLLLGIQLSLDGLELRVHPHALGTHAFRTVRHPLGSSPRPRITVHPLDGAANVLRTREPERPSALAACRGQGIGSFSEMAATMGSLDIKR